ncbi:hypothetical protein FA95DRAFT_1556017 [Auriscalpium vulgare]|uniref:Uncharacterized protein n=1 Tax=Auriscalpium vulgare TaxID=40419 RepID=A0ACB8S265_9AGAM|nr:hypothetical protein FA95DRAFT_1556017 [Auriscalpium vulgare]
MQISRLRVPISGPTCKPDCVFVVQGQPKFQEISGGAIRSNKAKHKFPISAMDSDPIDARDEDVSGDFTKCKVTGFDAFWERRPARLDPISVVLFAMEMKPDDESRGKVSVGIKLAFDLGTATFQRLAIGLPDAEIFGCTCEDGKIQIWSMRWLHNNNRRFRLLMQEHYGMNLRIPSGLIRFYVFLARLRDDLKNDKGLQQFLKMVTWEVRTNLGRLPHTWRATHSQGRPVDTANSDTGTTSSVSEDFEDGESDSGEDGGGRGSKRKYEKSAGGKTPPKKRMKSFASLSTEEPILPKERVRGWVNALELPFDSDTPEML